MSKTINLNVRISGTLSDHVSYAVGGEGDYDNVSEYVRDLIRRDKDGKEAKAFNILKAELQTAFSAPDSDFVELTAKQIIDRNN